MITASRSLLLCALLATCSAATTGRGQARKQASPPGPGRAVVVFLMPTDPTQEPEGLRDALLAQFALLDAELRFEPADDNAALDSQLQHAHDVAERQRAPAVFWLTSERAERWLVHMMDVDHDRVVVRAVDVSGEARSAAVEAVAVIARESTRAVLDRAPGTEAATATETATEAATEATTEAGTETATEAGSASAPTPPASGREPLRGPLRLALAYEGLDFATRSSFRHGLSLGGSVRIDGPWYAGGAIVLAGTIEKRQLPAFEVSRFPLRAFGGFRHQQGRLCLDAELGLGVEVLSRHTTGSDQPAVTSSGDSTRLLSLLSPRGRVEFRVVPRVGVHAGLGFEILLNNFSYVSENPERVTRLRPHRVRVVLETGVAFYP
jgi:hypothetical protein